MKIALQNTGAVIALAIILFASGCTPPPAGTNTNTSTNTNTAATTPAAKTASTAQSNVTLPLIDALFAEDNFAGELKSKLQLTDDQVNKLKSLAREETARLRESDDDDAQQGKTAAARRQAEQQIASAIGAEKAQQLYAFINERFRRRDGFAPLDARLGAYGHAHSRQRARLPHGRV